MGPLGFPPTTDFFEELARTPPPLGDQKTPKAMMAMAAIVAQNGATGQSLVEQFTTGARPTETRQAPAHQLA